MSSKCVTKLSHSCGSSDGLQVFQNKDGGYDGYCFSCGVFIPPGADDLDAWSGLDGKLPERTEKRKRETRPDTERIALISSYKTLPLEKRGLRKDTLEHFGVKVGVSEQDGKTPVSSHTPIYREGKIVAYMCRLLDPKKFWIVGDISNGELFGWPQAVSSGGKTLFITEGHEDAMALYQALKDKNKNTKWSDLEPAVVSLINGAKTARKSISENLNKIKSSFKDVVLVFDQDENGRQAVEDVRKVLPTARVAVLPCKDANECLIQGKSLALCNAVLFKAETPKSTRIVNAIDLWEEAAEPPKMGIPYPWEGLTDLTRGIRWGEVTYIGAGVKMGKSVLACALISHLIVEHGVPCFVAKPEEANNLTIKMIAGQVVGKIFHDPKVPFDRKAFFEARDKIKKDLHLLSVYQKLQWEDLRQDIIVAVENGCRCVFIDPITNLTTGMNSAEINTHLQDIAIELAALSKDLDIHTFMFCHLRAPDSGPPHERGGKVLSYQFAGSRAMMRSAQVMLGLEGNKDPDLELEQRNTRKLIVLEDRMFGASGFVPLYWNYQSGLFTEIKDD